MESNFIVKERTFAGQHIREYPDALANDQNDSLTLHAKQYIPRNNQHPEPGDATVLALHANGFAKEVYEPMWDDLLECAARQNLRIRSIWMADAATQGASGIMNEDKTGNDSHWFDHSRDLLCMINTFSEEFPRPLFGIGHSFGGAQLVYLSNLHPRLFESIVLLDPALSHTRPSRPQFNFARATEAILRKKDLFPSHEIAASKLRESRFLKGWDRRALDRHVNTSFRATPTALYPDVSGQVTLRTTKYAELQSTGRPNLEGRALKAPASLEDRITHPDVDTAQPLNAPFYIVTTRHAYSLLDALRPSVLYVLGEGSPTLLSPSQAAERLAKTGSGVGGSGGATLGRVKEVTVPGGHLICMTNPKGTAEEVARWLSAEWTRWRGQEERWLIARKDKSLRERKLPPDGLLEVIQAWDGKPGWTPKGKLQGKL